jgi:hypothetical protein
MFLRYISYHSTLWTGGPADENFGSFFVVGSVSVCEPGHNEASEKHPQRSVAAWLAHCTHTEKAFSQHAVVCVPFVRCCLVHSF